MKLQDVILRDTRTNQPAAAASNEGWLYYVTDEFILERSNGSTWQSVAPKTLWFGYGRGYSAPFLFGTTNYVDDGGWDSIDTTETEVGNIVPFDGTLKTLYIDVEANTLNADNAVFTIMKNGVATTLTQTVAFGVTSITSDATHTVSVSAGDRISLRGVLGGASGEVNAAYLVLLEAT